MTSTPLIPGVRNTREAFIALYPSTIPSPALAKYSLYISFYVNLTQLLKFHDYHSLCFTIDQADKINYKHLVNVDTCSAVGKIKKLVTVTCVYFYCSGTFLR